MVLMWRIKEYLFDRRMRKQRYKRGFSDEDCWNLDFFLSNTLPKMIIHLRDMNYGAPELDFPEYDDLPLYWKQLELEKLREKYRIEGHYFDADSIFTKWYILLTRMAYCLKQASADLDIENIYQKDFDKAFFSDEEIDEKLLNDYNKEEDRIQEAKAKMKDEAFDLIKTYFYSLWW